MTQLKATKREISSSGKLNLLRTSGVIPAVMYGGSKGNINLSLKKIHLKDILNTESFLSLNGPAVFIVTLPPPN